MNDVYKLLTNAEKHRKEDIDCAIKGLKQEAETINQFIRYTERGWALLEAQLNKERLVALKALSKSKLLLSKMELQIAESELNKENQRNPLKIPQFDSEDEGNNTSTEKKSKRRNTSTKLSSGKQRSPNTFKSRYNTRSQNNSSCIKESSTIEQANLKPNDKENGNIKCENPITQCSVSSSTPTDSNRNLTASIVTELVKPYTKIIDLPKTSIPINETVTTQKKLPQKRKIHPVSNIDAYKKPYTPQSLSYGSHVLYNPTADVKRPLHPGDPRTYYYKTDSKLKHPMMLPVPQMSGLVPTQSMRKPGVYIPQCTPVQNTTVSTTRKNQLPVNSEHKNWQQKYVPAVDTTKNYRSAYTPVPFTPKQGLNSRNYSVVTSKKLENKINYEHEPLNKVANINQMVLNKIERKDVSNLTPQQVNKWEKHICVPSPPMYCKSRHLYSGNTKNSN